jgi:filamentous hemagglutinin family protein
MKLFIRFCLASPTIILGYFISFLLPTKAQIVPDLTLPNNSIVNTDRHNNEITGGTTRGKNLFHSFEQFSLPQGEAFFNNARSIENIFSRVTGNLPSNINGLIRANGIANLFLLNPNGILFGSNARLDIGGSFIGTTADRVLFADGFEFSASTSSTTPLLTNDVPVGLGFAQNPGSIRIHNRGHQIDSQNLGYSPLPLARNNSITGLQVKPHKTLAIVGGDVTLDGGIVTSVEGQIQLGSVQSGIVNLTLNDSDLSLDYKNITLFKDLQLLNRSLVNAYGVNPSFIQIRGNNINLKDSSLVVMQNLGLLPDAELNIYATESLKIDGNSFDSSIPSGLITETIGKGSGGNINIETQTLALEDKGSVVTSSYSNAPGGNLRINASKRIEIRGNPPILLGNTYGLLTTTFRQGTSGNINLSTQHLSVRDGGGIGTTTFGQGSSGNINLSTQHLSVEKGGIIGTTTFGQGTSGNINLSTQHLSVRDGGGLAVATYGAGEGGNLTIKASENIRVFGFSPNRSIINSPFFNGNNFPSTIGTLAADRGNAGDLEIISKNLSLERGGNVGSATFGRGEGGNVFIKTSDFVELIGLTPESTPSFINSVTFGEGKAGDITIDTAKLKLFEGGLITTSTNASGDSGNITINAAEFIQIKGLDFLSPSPYGIDSSAFAVPQITREILGLPLIVSGSPGSITINTEHLMISNNGSIRVNNDGTGDAGRLQINAPSLFLDNSGSISATTASGRGGNIFINSNDLRLNENSSITATAGGAGDGGNININTDTLVGLNNSSITANAFAGRGGNITIATRSIFFSPDSFITATSELGVDGTVQIEILQPVRQEPIALYPKISTEQLLATSCFNRTEARGTFNYVGQSGLPLKPDSGFDSSGEAVKIPKPVAQDVSDSPQNESSVVASKRPWQIGDPIVEPDSIVKTPDGQVRFVNASVSQAPVSLEELICEPMQSQSGK